MHGMKPNIACSATTAANKGVIREALNFVLYFFYFGSFLMIRESGAGIRFVQSWVIALY